MIYEAHPAAVVIFITFVILVLGISFFLGRKTKSAKGYFAAGGKIHWSVNGIAFAGDYLSAASFLGICGMIAMSGYDGFLYSIGYLSGWVVALFIVAEPMKRLGKYTFADALDSKFNSKGIQLMAALSTLVVSMFYLIPQMVGAGALVTPLLGFPHYLGVIMVGAIVVFIVATAGMTSTTYVQFIKGGLLLVFSIILTILIITNGINQKPSEKYHQLKVLKAEYVQGKLQLANKEYKIIKVFKTKRSLTFVKLEKTIILDKEKKSEKVSSKEKRKIYTWWTLVVDEKSGKIELREALSIVKTKDGKKLYDGAEKEYKLFFPVGNAKTILVDGKEVKETGSLGIFSFLEAMQNTTIIRFSNLKFDDNGDSVNVYYQVLTPGKRFMRPGLKFKIDKGANILDRLNFISLMFALFFGTAALPHILIRYYTVKKQSDARKSTIVAIGAIGLFYILTLYMGLGAAVNGVLDLESSNMSAPLVAKYFGIWLFSIISAIAFATVLGTVSGLIIASSGAVAHDFMHKFLNLKLTDKAKVLGGKITAIAVGIVAITLGILFKGMNVSFLVGWAFAVAASANLPAIIMLLFWKKTTGKGITASIGVGMISAVGLILLSPEMFVKYGMDPSSAIIPINNPGIISIPLSFLTLVVVSLLTQKKQEAKVDSEPKPEVQA